jgi:hypothetical protein
MNLFYAATTITIGKWEDCRLLGLTVAKLGQAKGIAPLIFEASKRKNCTMAQALHNKGWVANIKMDTNFTVHHIHEYVRLWVRLQDVHLLQEDNEDAIVWNLTSNDEYSSASVYDAQFFIAILTRFNKMV